MLSDDARREYAANQYNSIREACNQAREAHQSILNWSEAVTATLFAAGLVAVSSNSGRFILAAQFVFGLVLPAILLRCRGLGWRNDSGWRQSAFSCESSNAPRGVEMAIKEKLRLPGSSGKTSSGSRRSTALVPLRKTSHSLRRCRAFLYCYVRRILDRLLDYLPMVGIAHRGRAGGSPGAYRNDSARYPGAETWSAAPTISDQDLAEWASELLDNRLASVGPTPSSLPERYLRCQASRHRRR